MKTGRDVAALVAGLLDRDLDALELHDAARLAAHVDTGARSQAGTVFIFRLGTEWLALPPAIIDEVLDIRRIHGLPHRRGGVVRGIVGVRGRLTVLVSLHQLLGGGAAGAPDRGAAAAPRLVVLVSNGERLAFEVDEVFGNHRFDPASVRPAPATVSQAGASFTSEVLPWGDHSVGLLDSGLVLHALDRQLG